jgi:hypothetical protein
MPKTSLFETNVFVQVEETDDSDDEYYDKYLAEFVKPGMTFRMDYTHTRNYQSEKATTHVTVVSVRSVIECCCTVSILGTVLKTEEPIYICVSSAALGESIYLYDDADKLVAKGGVQRFNDPGAKNFT